MQFTTDFIKKALPSGVIMQGEVKEGARLSIDSRTLKAGEIFVALKGSATDGHIFIADALKKGASGIIIEQERKGDLASLDVALLKGKLIIVVPDTLAALIDLATAWRELFQGKVVGITGSVGKTTTKCILANILECANVSAYISVDNQNTFLGLALNILNLRPEHNVGVFEVGISRRGEMAQKAAMLKPTTAVITTVGHSHMEGLGSIVDIALEKRDIFKYFKEDSIGIINGDQPNLAATSYPHPVIRFGSKTTNQIQARKIQIGNSAMNYLLRIYGEKFKIEMRSSHIGTIYNSLAAASVAYLLGITSAAIAQGVLVPVKVPGRFERRELIDVKGVLFNDAYNASPESMKAALMAFEKVETEGYKIAVLGDMLELGVNTPFWHRQLGRLLRKTPTLKDVVLVGKHVEWAKKTLPVGVKISHVPTWQEAVKLMKTKLDKESAVLVKGSRAMGLTNLVQELSREKAS